MNNLKWNWKVTRMVLFSFTSVVVNPLRMFDAAIFHSDGIFISQLRNVKRLYDFICFIQNKKIIFGGLSTSVSHSEAYRYEIHGNIRIQWKKKIIVQLILVVTRVLKTFYVLLYFPISKWRSKGGRFVVEARIRTLQLTLMNFRRILVSNFKWKGFNLGNGKQPSNFNTSGKRIVALCNQLILYPPPELNQAPILRFWYFCCLL